MLGFQSTLAWELGVNVANVSYHASRSISSGETMVLFEPHGLGWNVGPIHTPAGERARCDPPDDEHRVPLSAAPVP